MDHIPEKWCNPISKEGGAELHLDKCCLKFDFSKKHLKVSHYNMLHKVKCTQAGSLDLVVKGFVVFLPFEALPDRAAGGVSARQTCYQRH